MLFGLHLVVSPADAAVGAVAFRRTHPLAALGLATIQHRRLLPPQTPIRPPSPAITTIAAIAAGIANVTAATAVKTCRTSGLSEWCFSQTSFHDGL